MSTLYEYYHPTPDDSMSFVTQGQTFTPSTAHTITSVVVYLQAYQLTFTVYVMATDGAGLPIGDPLCSVVEYIESLEWESHVFNFSPGANLAAGTKYAFILSAEQAGQPAVFDIVVKASGEYTSGTHVRYLGGWALTAADVWFEEWGDAVTYRTENYIEIVQDARGRPIFEAECKAYNYNGVLLETEYSDNGIATFTQIPVDVPVYIESRWGKHGYKRTDNIFCSSGADILTMVTKTHVQNTDDYTNGVQMTTEPAAPPEGRWYVG